MDKRTQDELDKKLDKAEAKPYFSVLLLVGRTILLGGLGLVAYLVKKLLGI